MFQVFEEKELTTNKYTSKHTATVQMCYFYCHYKTSERIVARNFKLKNTIKSREITAERKYGYAVV